MRIQMVCDSTPSLVSAAIRDALHSTGSNTTNGRTVTGHGYGTTSSSSNNGVTVNGTGSSGTHSTPVSKQQLPFRRTIAAPIDTDYDQYDEPEDGGPNDLVESISQSLRQGQQVKPITYEEGPSYTTSLDKLKSKYIVLKAATPTTDSTACGVVAATLSNSNTSSSSPSPFGAGLSKATTGGGAPNAIPLTMNGGGSMKFSASSQLPSAAKSSGNIPQQQNGVPASATSSSTAAGRMDTTTNTTLPTPKRTLFPRESVQIGWKTTGRKWLVGAGMMNMGNTCYLNSTLQALFHVPAIANWLLSDEPHRVKCDDGGSGGSCIICAMAKTLLESQTNHTAFRPYLVYSKLRLVCKHLVPGRQEDAHEFLRYLVEAMEKSYLNRSKNSKELDQYSKETTPLNQILGGYLRSEVKCLSCQHVSTTFQHFEDLLLDIRKANSIDEALELYFARERLEEMGYKCEACKRRVAATKQFSLERAPFVLCIQLKRFSMLSGKINKHVELRSKLDLTPYSSPAMRTNGGKLTYRLTSMVTHLGSTQHCGHYTAIGHTDAAGYHVFDDSSVRPIGIQNVMNTNAYILFYELESVAAGAIGLPNGTCRPKATVSVGQPSSTATLTSMGHLSNGTTPTGGGSGASGNSNGGGSSGGGGSGGTPGKSINSSPLRVLGIGGGNGSAGGLFPSKLEQKPGLIGPVLPTAQPTSTASPSAATGATVSNATGKAIGSGSSGGPTTTTTSLTSSASASGRDMAIFSSPSSTASTLSNASPLSSPSKQQESSASKIPKLPDINARYSNGTEKGEKVQKGGKSLSTPLLASMPKLNSPNKSSDSNVNGCSSSSPAAVISLVPYDSDDTSSSTSEDEDEKPHSSSKSIVLTNGNSGGSAAAKRAKQLIAFASNGKRSAVKNIKTDEADEDEDDDEDEKEDCAGSAASRSPQMIKTKAGLWRVSNTSTADQLSYPDSGSASSSKSSSPATSGVSSPTNSPGQKPTLKLPLKNAASGGEPASASLMSNGHHRPSATQQNGVSSNWKGNKSASNGYHPNVGSGAESRSSSPGGEGKGNGSSSAVHMLMKYSHRGYGAPVKSWNGQQTAMERELANERREERKRQIEEDRETEMDRGRVKKTKGAGVNGGGGGNTGGSNPFQQYQTQGVGGGGGGGKWMGNGGANRNHFHNHHQNNYRSSGGSGGGYYQNGNGNRHHGASGGFRTGGRRFGGGGGGGRNGGGFHTKAHQHHQRGEPGSGMAGGGGSSNGFYHR